MFHHSDWYKYIYFDEFEENIHWMLLLRLILPEDAIGSIQQLRKTKKDLTTKNLSESERTALSELWERALYILYKKSLFLYKFRELFDSAL